jgi:acyl-[acyl carrier protein]--UDP-N-acetylglucosamine O-acyltransferase
MFAKAYGNPARVQGTNTVGMERLSISTSAIETVSKLNQSPGDSELQKVVESEPELAKYLN